jgi:exodeoxyribonuclease VII small subunit
MAVMSQPTEPTTTYEQAREESRPTSFAGSRRRLTREESLILWERGEQLARLCQHWPDRARERLSAAAPARSSDES